MSTPSRDGRRYLPCERKAVVHGFTIAGHEGSIRVGLYDDGTPGEIFLELSKAGTITSGLADAFSLAVSLLLQHGVTVEDLAGKFVGARFEPLGVTDNPEIRQTSSVLDYVFRWLTGKFGTRARPAPSG